MVRTGVNFRGPPPAPKPKFLPAYHKQQRTCYMKLKFGSSEPFNPPLIPTSCECWLRVHLGRKRKLRLFPMIFAAVLRSACSKPDPVACSTAKMYIAAAKIEDGYFTLLDELAFPSRRAATVHTRSCKSIVLHCFTDRQQ